LTSYVRVQVWLFWKICSFLKNMEDSVIFITLTLNKSDYIKWLKL
jgi:hypothetical protein